VTILTSDNPRGEDPCMRVELYCVAEMPCLKKLQLTHFIFISGHLGWHVGWCRMVNAWVFETRGEWLLPSFFNGHHLFLHDIRPVAVRCAVALGEEGDMVSAHFAAPAFEDYRQMVQYFQGKLNCSLEIIPSVILCKVCLLNTLNCRWLLVKAMKHIRLKVTKKNSLTTGKRSSTLTSFTKLG